VNEWAAKSSTQTSLELAREILGEVYRRHAALTERALDAIPIGERGAKTLNLERQRRMHRDRLHERVIALRLRG
jgi:hypothetical protein